MRWYTTQSINQSIMFVGQSTTKRKKFTNIRMALHFHQKRFQKENLEEVQQEQQQPQILAWVFLEQLFLLKR